jgi:transposase
VVDGVTAVLFCAWLAWSRFRVIFALPDRTMPSVISALDRTQRVLGGAPTYWLTDNERTVSTAHVAGLAVRNRTMLSVAHYYGVSLHTCVPADPESKGGAESSVKLAKADVLPRPDNLVGEYRDFDAFEAARAEATDRFNTRVHTV